MKGLVLEYSRLNDSIDDPYIYQVYDDTAQAVVQQIQGFILNKTISN